MSGGPVVLLVAVDTKVKPEPFLKQSYVTVQGLEFLSFCYLKNSRSHDSLLPPDKRRPPQQPRVDGFSWTYTLAFAPAWDL